MHFQFMIDEAITLHCIDIANKSRFSNPLMLIFCELMLNIHKNRKSYTESNNE